VVGSGHVFLDQQAFEISMAISQTLPELLTNTPSLFDVHSNGKVAIAGHRVPVYVFMEAMAEIGESPNRIGELETRFPTLESSLLQDVVRFLDQHSSELSCYFTQERKIAQEAYEETEKGRSGPTLEELRERRSKRLES
jgi:hypothetical protein